MNVLLLGGNATARKMAELLLLEGFDVTLSVASDEGLTTVPPGASVLVGRRDRDNWSKIFQEKSFDIAIDGAHPFAVEASKNFREAAGERNLPYLALKRPSLVPPGAYRCCDSAEAAEAAVELTKEGDLIFLAIGVKLLASLVPLFRKERRLIRARVLPTTTSIAQALTSGLQPQEIVAFWGAPGTDLETALLSASKAACLLCKDSGLEGGMEAKAAATEALSIPLVIINRSEENPEALVARDLIRKLQRWKGITVNEDPQEREEQT
jgi:precorrin-6x reductase